MIDQIENSMEVINIHLNNQRNKIINLSLLMEMMGVNCGIGAVIGGVFGMNLKNNIQEDSSAFYLVTAIIIIAMMGCMLAGLIIRWYTLNLAKPTNVKYQHSALKHIFSYIDDIETKIHMNEFITPEIFEMTVEEIIGDKVDKEEIGLFYKVYDKDKDNYLTKSEFLLDSGPRSLSLSY